jgi:uncharacterized protein (UPF0333 family)
MKYLFTVIFIFVIAVSLFSGGAYNPKPGDDVILITHKFNKDELDNARKYFTGTFLTNLKDDKIIRDTYFLENTEINELVIITFASPGEANLNLDNDDFYIKNIKSKVAAMTSSVAFKLIAVNDEQYQPRLGEYVMIWEYNLKAKNFSDAGEHFKNKVYPLLSKDKHSRDSYLIGFKMMNIMVGITMFNGNYEETAEVKKKFDELTPLLDKPVKSKSYKMVGLNDE